MATWTMVGQFSGVPYSAKGMSIVTFRDRGRQVYYACDHDTEADIMATFPALKRRFRDSARLVVVPWIPRLTARFPHQSRSPGSRARRPTSKTSNRLRDSHFGTTIRIHSIRSRR